MIHVSTRSSEENEKKVTPPEEYTALKMAKDVIDRLLKIILALIVTIVIIFAGFLIFIHFTTTNTVELTTEADATSVISGDSSTITTYPNTNTNTNK